MHGNTSSPEDLQSNSCIDVEAVAIAVAESDEPEGFAI